MATPTCPWAVPQHITHVNDLSTILNRWNESYEWVKWHGWQFLLANHDPTYVPISPFRGRRWCRMATPTCTRAIPQHITHVNDLSTILNRWNESYEWVKWHGWQFLANHDPTYVPISPFQGRRWCRMATPTCTRAIPQDIVTNVNDPSTILDGWNESSEWVKCMILCTVGFSLG